MFRISIPLTCLMLMLRNMVQWWASCCFCCSERGPWAQMEFSEETKVRSAQLVSVLLSYASETTVIYGLTFFFFFLHHLSHHLSQHSVEVGLCMKRRFSQSVRGDSSKSIWMYFHSVCILTFQKSCAGDNPGVPTFTSALIGTNLLILK